MDYQDLMLTALRASLIYFFLLFVIRLLGKREVGASSAFDFMVALMLGEVVDEAIFGDVSMVKGLLAISVIAAWHLVNAWASFRSKTVQKITSASPTVLVEHGKMKQENLAKERIHQDEVEFELRMAGIDEIKEVKKATLEPNGKVSVIKEDWAEAVQKQDFPVLLEKEKPKKSTGGQKQTGAAKG